MKKLYTMLTIKDNPIGGITSERFIIKSWY